MKIKTSALHYIFILHITVPMYIKGFRNYNYIINSLTRGTQNFRFNSSLIRVIVLKLQLTTKK